MNRGVLAAACAALVASSIAAGCREPSQPPQTPVPPKPTNPTNGGNAVTLTAAIEPEIVTDASIVREAGPVPPGDAGVGLVDAAPVVAPH